MKAAMRAAPPARMVARAVGAEKPQDRHLQPALLREREATCSSYSFETAYAQRRLVGGPRTSVPSSAKGGVAFP